MSSSDHADSPKNSPADSNDLIQISSTKFVLGCALAAIAIYFLGTFYRLSASLVAAEVLLTILCLFLFGSMKYRIDKNAITYGMVLVVFSTFWGVWWQGSGLQQAMAADGAAAAGRTLRHYLLTLHGLDELVHADTMLFILGLTFFVAVIAQTRLLESISFSVLRKNRGMVVPTVAILTGVVAFSSGILDGVSMIGLMIRILVMILFLAKAKDEAVLYAVMVSTVVTTVCGMWLAYGEPPNLIMKANLHPHLDNAFFLRYCLPVAVGSYLIVFWNVRKRLKGKKVDTKDLDILDLHTADVRFLQALRHGEVLTAVEFIDEFRNQLGDHHKDIERRLHKGEPLGLALVHESVAPALRREILEAFVSENLAEELDEHYVHVAKRDGGQSDDSLEKVSRTIRSMRRQRVRTQWIGGLAFIPFIGLLVWHAIDHDIPLFLASFAAFAVAFLGIAALSKMRRLALREGRHEYMEYLFLLPLFFSITLLQKTGFFEHIKEGLHAGIERLGISVMAYLQFLGASFLSAILDNNVVADFAGRAIHGLEIGALHLFAMAQIAGYAVGGCWTHIGSAQSVVAYAFIRREINNRFTPFGWMKAMTPVIIEIFVLMTLVVYGEALLLRYFPDH
ncbi:MAG TPA: SLC13 family permease [bacterium]|nr:SLC13 family permease [bacterium]